MYIVGSGQWRFVFVMHRRGSVTRELGQAALFLPWGSP